MSETKPLTMSAEQEANDRCNRGSFGHYARSIRAYAEIDALRAALAEAQRERDEARAEIAACVRVVQTELPKLTQNTKAEVDRLQATIMAKFGEFQTALAAAQLNARTLREALEPFALFARKWRANPISGLDDALYTIHSGEISASLCLSDCKRADAALSAPADEAALRQVEREAEARGVRIGANAARDLMQRLIRSPYVGEPDFIDRCVDSVTPKSALGAPETHAKEG